MLRVNICIYIDCVLRVNICIYIDCVLRVNNCIYILTVWTIYYCVYTILCVSRSDMLLNAINIYTIILLSLILYMGLSWPWSFGSWIYNYLCNQCLSPLTLWVRIQLMWGVLQTTLYDKFCQLLVTGRGFLQVLQFPPPIKLTATI